MRKKRYVCSAMERMEGKTNDEKDSSYYGRGTGERFWPKSRADKPK